MISIWLRVIRVRFLLASVIAVSVGLAISWWQTTHLDFINAILTMGGVLALHASVDLLNDYWDFKRGIDVKTQRTKMSGGTGVLPEGLLEPSKVYRAGFAFLVIGTLIGAYFVLTNGVVIGVILAFAIVSIYFYSTKIVDSGLAEVFVIVKGTMIVLGTHFIQTSEIGLTPIMAGIVIGILSALVLLVTSFPDYEADKSKGRRTLVIVAGKEKATLVFWVFPITSYVILIAGTLLEIFPFYCLITLLAIPLVIRSGSKLKHDFDDIKRLVPVMSSTLSFSRLTGTLFVIGFLLSH